MPGLEGSARVFTWSALARRYSVEEFRPVVETLRQVPFRRFRHNFLRVNVNPTDRPFDMLLAFGPSASCLGREAQPERTYGLLGSFVDGMLAGAGGRGTVVEGFEFSYPYRSCDRFQEAYAALRGPCRELSLDPRRYDRWLEIGFGIWLDFDSGSTCQDPAVAGRPCRWFDPSLYPPERRDLVDPETFARAVGAALSVSDSYVWIYTTEPKWWTEANPLGENLPEAYVQALARARGAAPHVCPRPDPALPGSALPESTR